MNEPAEQNLATQTKDAPKEFRLNYTSATDNPTATDDETLGFHIHSTWFNQDSGKLFICTDASEGAAAWERYFIGAVEFTGGLEFYGNGFRVKERALFNPFSDETTSGTTRENLFTYSIPANLLSENGDHIRGELSGNYAANANGKYIFIDFDGTDIGESDEVLGNDIDWTIDFYIIRKTSSVARAVAEFTASGVNPQIRYSEIAGVDFTASIDLKLDARTPTASGDVTFRCGWGKFIPAAETEEETETYYLLFGGDRLVFNGDPLTFNP